MKKCGFVAILGVPNAGKSTLVNQLVGSKVSIVSPKVQTTRQRILGIVMIDETQLILADTPGIFTPKKRLDQAMVQAAWSAGEEADICAVIIDVTRKDHRQSQEILKNLSNHPNAIVILNKIDLVEKGHLLPLCQDLHPFVPSGQIFMISASSGEGISDLTHYLSAHVPEGPWLYPADYITDLPQRLWAAEITREHLFLKLQQEIPYDTWVETQEWEEFQNGSVKIHQTIYTARASQKPILLGKKGHQIKAISLAARKELSNLLGRTVHLFLHVKHMDDWQNRPAAYRMMGLSFEGTEKTAPKKTRREDAD